MEINYICNKKFQFEKNLWITYITKVQLFKKNSTSTDSYTNIISILSTNLQFQRIEVDLTEFPKINVKMKNLFFVNEMQKKLLENWCRHLEDQVFVWSKTGNKTDLHSISLLASPSYAGFSEFVSRLVIPVGLIMLFNLVIYTFLCFAILKGIIQEIQFDEGAPPSYLNIHQLKPTVVDLYQSNTSILKAAFLAALLGGGWFLGAQQLLICFLIKFGGGIFRNVIFSIFILGIFQGLIYFTPANYEWMIFFVSLTMISYLLFGFFSRNLPFFEVKKSL